MKGVRQVFGWPPRRGGDVATPPLPINTQNLQAGPQDPSPLPPHKSVPSSPIPVIYASSPQFFPDVEESKATEHIARPKNSFFFFRADFIKKKKTEIGKSKGVTQKHLSKLAGEAWRQLPLEEREVYDQMAAAARIEHARAHPDYKFRPKRKSRSSSSLRPSTSSGRKRQPRSPLPHSPVSTYGTPTSPLSAHDTDGSLFSLEVDDEHEPPYNSHRRSLSAPHFSKLLSEAPRLEFPSDTPHAEYRRSKSFTEGTSFMPVYYGSLTDLTDVGSCPPHVFHYGSFATAPTTPSTPAAHLAPLAAVASSLSGWDGSNVQLPLLSPRSYTPTPPVPIATVPDSVSVDDPLGPLRDDLTSVSPYINHEQLTWNTDLTPHNSHPMVDPSSEAGTSLATNIPSPFNQFALQEYAFGLSAISQAGEEPLWNLSDFESVSQDFDSAYNWGGR